MNTADLFSDSGDSEAVTPQVDNGQDIRLSSVSQLRIVDERKYGFGLQQMDKAVNPFRPGEFIIAGAREGHGKTAIIERFALHNSSEHKVLMASLDMKPAEVQDRCLGKFLLCSTDEVQHHRHANSAEYISAMESLYARDFLCWEPKGANESSLRGITEKAEDTSAEILIIDYIALVHGWEPGLKAREMVDWLFRWARARRITTIVLTQLRDDAVGKRPHNGNIQDTTRLAQRADRIVLLYRPFLGHPVRDKVTEVIWTKNRKGETFRGHLGWTGITMDYYELTDDEERLLTCCRNR